MVLRDDYRNDVSFNAMGGRVRERGLEKGFGMASPDNVVPSMKEVGC